MLPFCRTVDECRKTLDVMKEFGLERGISGLKVYLMCEIPSNVIEANEFSPMIDGVSIGDTVLVTGLMSLRPDSKITIQKILNPQP